MSLSIAGKVALVTGSAGGIGLCFVKNLLQNKIKGVTIADLNTKRGIEVETELKQKYGPDRVIFVETDVASKRSFENAFKKTVEKFKNIDILINNAGIFEDVNWEKEVSVNLNGTINGTLLGFEEYLQKYRSGEEGIIVNIASIAGVQPISTMPIYCATKFGIVGLSKSLASKAHYKRTGVRVLVICPGITKTDLFFNSRSLALTPFYMKMLNRALDNCYAQEPSVISNFLPKIIEEGKNGSIWIVENDKMYEIELVDRKQFESKY